MVASQIPSVPVRVGTRVFGWIGRLLKLRRRARELQIKPSARGKVELLGLEPWGRNLGKVQLWGCTDSDPHHVELGRIAAD